MNIGKSNYFSANFENEHLYGINRAKNSEPQGKIERI